MKKLLLLLTLAISTLTSAQDLNFADTHKDAGERATALLDSLIGPRDTWRCIGSRCDPKLFSNYNMDFVKLGKIKSEAKTHDTYFVVPSGMGSDGSLTRFRFWLYRGTTVAGKFRKAPVKRISVLYSWEDERFRFSTYSIHTY
ncbi:hypothetical protein [Chitinophaga sp. sic0106]|uniref:hypothetical protein n=1 Tax=Chitinophaga sp. sic0106 TaxID=2854785 RepID=UPI001C44A8F5|nr:hypothetical protein [Chitinophaga sp. sic0106]MBV7531305.1 hypothetical protein [Chitinophaga sp. sic0106]